MEIIKSKNKKISKRETGLIAQCLIKDGVAILPTSTIYGISCLYNNKNALERVYDIKNRKKNIPFIILISRIESLENLIEDKNILSDRIIKKYWISKNPLPVTLLFKRNKRLKKYITRSNDKIAIRMDPLKIINDIISITGPIISTSANISGQKNISPKNISEIPYQIRKKVDILLDFKAGLSGISSTIIDVSGNKPVIIREGTVKLDDLSKLNII